MQPLQRWDPEGVLLQLRLWGLHWLGSQGLLLQLLLWLGPVVENQLLQQQVWLWVRLQQTYACAAWQLLPASFAVLVQPCDAPCSQRTEHVACQLLLQVKGLAQCLLMVVGFASAGQTAAAAWRTLLLLPLYSLAEYVRQAVAIRPLQQDTTLISNGRWRLLPTCCLIALTCCKPCHSFCLPLPVSIMFLLLLRSWREVHAIALHVLRRDLRTCG